MESRSLALSGCVSRHSLVSAAQAVQGQLQLSSQLCYYWLQCKHFAANIEPSDSPSPYWKTHGGRLSSWNPSWSLCAEQLLTPHVYTNIACCMNLIWRWPTKKCYQELMEFFPSQFLSAFPKWRAFPQVLHTLNTLFLMEICSSFLLLVLSLVSQLLLFNCYTDRWRHPPQTSSRLLCLGYSYIQSIQQYRSYVHIVDSSNTVLLEHQDLPTDDCEQLSSDVSLNFRKQKLAFNTSNFPSTPLTP